MDRSRVAEAALWLSAAIGGAAALATWQRPGSALLVGAAPRAAPSPPGSHRLDPGAGRGSAPTVPDYDPFRLAEHDPFRFAHRPAQVAFGSPVSPALAIGPVASFPGPSLRPRLALLGIVGASGRWEAVLGGAPGHDAGALVHAGDTLSGLRVQRVTAESLVVQARDTVWRLALSGGNGIGARP